MHFVDASRSKIEYNPSRFSIEKLVTFNVQLIVVAPVICSWTREHWRLCHPEVASREKFHALHIMKGTSTKCDKSNYIFGKDKDEEKKDNKGPAGGSART